MYVFFFFQAEDGIRDKLVTGVQTCALPISERAKMVEAGGDDLIVKPIGLRDLQVRVRALLRLKELRRDLNSTQESLRELVKRENPTESKEPFDDRVAITAQALARLIGLDAEDQEVAFHAGLLL